MARRPGVLALLVLVVAAAGLLVVVALGTAGAPGASSRPGPTSPGRTGGPPVGGSQPAVSPAASSSAPAYDPESGLTTIRRAALPREALQTLDLIAAGGPFPYPQDGITYRNLERILPNRPGGYYREYTVETPGSPDRGARRIVRGAAGELYWTADHYASFRWSGP
jgi:ribonuclease T1